MSIRDGLKASLGTAYTTIAGRAAAWAVFAFVLAAPAEVRVAPPLVRANDNRIAAGRLHHDTLHLRLVVEMATWRPESDTGPAVAVEAFGEEGKAPQIPAPLIRVREGATIAASVRNALPDSTIAIIGLAEHPTAKRDTLFVRPGETKSVRFAAGSPGTYLYRAVIGAHSPDDTLHEREQAAGAFVVDSSAGASHDRIFVINIWGEQKGPTEYANALTINGRSWPYTERLDAVVGDTVHWRVVNASNRGHPMHLHGAYFRLDAKGDAFEDTAYTASARRLVVTEELSVGQTMRLDWSPVRPGRWVFHCHIAFHVVPSLARLVPDDAASHDGMSGKPLEHMAGLVLGIDAKLPANKTEPKRGAPRRLDLYVQEGPGRGHAKRSLSFILERGETPPAPDSVSIPGTVLVLRRNEPTDVLVHNRLQEATAVHWHGLELESFSDGVAGWSGAPGKTASPIPAGGTFLAHLSMPRAGTFIYHTHLHDVSQLTSGLYGAIVVLEPGEQFDPRTDHVFVSGWDGYDETGATFNVIVNGDSLSSPPLEMRVGETHRFRFVNIGPATPQLYTLRRDSTLVEWRAIAKDGANLPASQATVGPAQLLIDVGETYDFHFKPTQPGELTLSTPVTPAGPKGPLWTRRIIVR
jgi:FtsP/CotA-like multicopper oxidase with cupredoxin domain